MKLSLRTKLFVPIILAISFAVVPFSIYTFGNLKQSYLQKEQANFTNIVNMVEDGVSSRYLNFITSQVVTILRHKEQLKRTTNLLIRNWTDMAVLDKEVKTYLMHNQVKYLSSFGLTIAYLAPSGEYIVDLKNINTPINWANIIDFTGRPLISRLNPKLLSQDGEFAVFKATIENGREETFLGFFKPDLSNSSVIIAVVKITDIANESSVSIPSMIKSAQEKFDSLKLNPNSFIILVDNKNKTLAYKNGLGQEAELDHAKIIEELNKQNLSSIVNKKSLNPVQSVFEQAKQQELVELTTNLGFPLDNTFLHIKYFKPLEWFIVMGIPELDIELPAKQMRNQMILMALIAMLLSTVGTLWVTAKIIKPLQILTRKANMLSSIDFSNQNAAKLIKDDLPIDSADEVGQLAVAFAQMGEALSTNIQDLMQTTKIKERFEGELDAARDIQLGILPAPESAPNEADYSVAVLLQAAKEVGGDLYDFFVAPDGRKVVVVGDVSDKGVPAALFMAMTTTMVRHTIGSGLSPAAAMAQINARLSENNPSSMFVTLFIGLFNQQTGELEYANGGHCEPIVISEENTKSIRTLACLSGPLVGAIVDAEYVNCYDSLSKHELCLIYSDGVTEAMDNKLNLFGLNRLEGLLLKAEKNDPSSTLNNIIEAVKEHRRDAEQSDDITMLAFCRH